MKPMPGQKMDMFTMQPKTTPPPAHMSSTPTHGSSHHSYHQSPHRGGGGGAEPMGATTPSHQPQPQQPQAGQPVEFNHAINYVNKIKVRLPSSHRGSSLCHMKGFLCFVYLLSQRDQGEAPPVHVK